MEKIIKVVAAVIENEKNEILCTLRPIGKILGNNWEFPGGKLEKGETEFEGIKREIKEEVPYYITAFKEQNVGLQKYVENFKQRPAGHHRLYGVKFKENADK